MKYAILKVTILQFRKGVVHFMWILWHPSGFIICPKEHVLHLGTFCHINTQIWLFPASLLMHFLAFLGNLLAKVSTYHMCIQTVLYWYVIGTHPLNVVP